MRSKLAEQLRQEQIEEIRRMSPGERVALALALRESGLKFYAAAQKLDEGTAVDRIRRSRQVGRCYSRCMAELSK